MTSEKVPESVLTDASAFLGPKYTIEDAYAVLGMQLDAVEALDKPESFDKWRGLSVDTTEMKVDFVGKARAFLAKFWNKLAENVCAWWKDNRNKVGDKLVAGITPIVAGIIPQPWGAIAGIVALVVMILIKSGFDAVYMKKPAKQPL